MKTNIENPNAIKLSKQKKKTYPKNHPELCITTINHLEGNIQIFRATPAFDVPSCHAGCICIVHVLQYIPPTPDLESLENPPHTINHFKCRIIRKRETRPKWTIPFDRAFWFMLPCQMLLRFWLAFQDVSLHNLSSLFSTTE